MERTEEKYLVPAEHRSIALAFDRSRRNRRPAFALQQTLQRFPDGAWHSQRQWQGVGIDAVASETIVWRDGLVESHSEQTSIEEVAMATVRGVACRTLLRSGKTGGGRRERELVLPHPAVTLGSLPLFIAQHWAELVDGQSIAASYLVLKVQRAARVQLARTSDGSARELVIAATPANPLLRWIFGSTLCVFTPDAPRLLRIEGLLDPRDLKANGRWREYLGSIEFDQPLDLSGLASREGRL
jgi:hypothetical protein